MRATGDEAAVKFGKFVELAKGDSFLVYRALSEIKNVTDEKVEAYIRLHTGTSDRELALEWLNKQDDITEDVYNTIYTALGFPNEK